MIAILGGLGAAVCWAAALLTTSRASRQIGAWSTLAWVMTIGLVITVPAIVASSAPVTVGSREVGLMVVIGAANIGGLLAVYTALRGGNVSVVGPIVSTEGAIAALIAVVAGEQLAPGAGAVLGAIVIGVVLATRERTADLIVEPGADGPVPPALVHDSPLRTAALALTAATLFGINIYLVGVLGNALPAIWTALPARVLGAAAVALPLLLVGRLRLTRRALPFVVVAAFGEVAGTVSLAIGAQDGIAVASVMSSQFAAIAAVAAVILFRERLSRTQVVGIAAIAVGVATLTLIRS